MKSRTELAAASTQADIFPPVVAEAAPPPAGKKARKAKRAKTPVAGAIEPCGADVLRLWVALSDWRSDVSIGEITISKVRSQRDHNPPRRPDQP